MKTCGIIAEYNPFHQGHIHQIQSIRDEFDAIVVITSAYFSQRGLPSLLTPYDKARLALKHGVNLVCELPTHLSAQSAEYFAKYAIQSLSCMGIDELCFGSECHSLEQLEVWFDQIQAKQADPTKSMHQQTPERIQPNDILGMHYVQYCKEYQIQPHPIPRNESYASATSLRQMYFAGGEPPFSSLFHKEQDWKNYYAYLKNFLLLSDPEDLRSYFLVNEGIEYRLKKAAQAETWHEFLTQTISKTYTKARIQRTCLMILLQVKKRDMQNIDFHSVQVLGFDAVGQQLLKKTRVSTQFHELSPLCQKIETKTLALYNSVMKNNVQREEVIHP